MSQEKVARYKEEKANRKQAVKKQRMKRTINKWIGVLVAVLFIGFVGYSGYDLYQKSQPRDVAEVDYTALEEYLTDLSAEDAE